MTTASIPASQLVSVQPGVLGAGGNPLSLNTVMLSPNSAIPVGVVLSFATLANVVTFFGAGSQEAERAAIYFSGFTNANTVPGALLFAQYNTTAIAGFMRGGNIGATTLATVQALSGTITLSVNGTQQTSSTINLSSATSFSNAATLIQAAVTGVTVTFDSQRNAFLFTSNTTGSTSSVSVATVGAFATGLFLTTVTGAITSVGAAVAVPATLMASIVAITQNWFTFMTTVEPADAVKTQFAQWVQTTNDAFLYVVSDSNVLAFTANSSTTFGALAIAAQYDGVLVNADTTGGDVSAFVCGMIASINFNQTNGRITLAYKAQAGLPTQVSGATAAQAAIGNGYNFYGQYATPNNAFNFYQNGQIAGKWVWADAYVNQRLINSGLQLALMNLLATVLSVPYNQAGYTLIRQACADTINTALAFGAIQPGVTLSALQAAEVNQAAGRKIDTVLSTVGFYLQVNDPGATVRGQRGTPACTFWYADGGSIQQINLASIDVM